MIDITFLFYHLHQLDPRNKHFNMKTVSTTHETFHISYTDQDVATIIFRQFIEHVLQYNSIPHLNLHI